MTSQRTIEHEQPLDFESQEKEIHRLTALHGVQEQVAAALAADRPAQLLQFREQGVMQHQLFFTDEQGKNHVYELYLDEYLTLSNLFCSREIEWGEADFLPEENAPDRCHFSIADADIRGGDTALTFSITTTSSTEHYTFTFSDKKKRNAAYEMIRMLLCMNSPEEPVTVFQIMMQLTSEVYGGVYQPPTA